MCHHFKRNRVIVGGIDQQWQMDLADMQSMQKFNDGYRYVRYKFKIGDQVRISKVKRTFEKGYLPNFSKEIFAISKQIPRDPPVYKLKDLDGEELKGTFYEKELQKVIKGDDV
jgi:hypothetical protein